MAGLVCSVPLAGRRIQRLIARLTGRIGAGKVRCCWACCEGWVTKVTGCNPVALAICYVNLIAYRLERQVTHTPRDGAQVRQQAGAFMRPVWQVGTV